MWKTFKKAGKPGWGSIVPFLNIYMMLEIAGRPGWWLLLYFIPVVNIFIGFIVAIDIAKSFGKSSAFGFFGLGLFSFIGYLILGFGSATYHGPSAADISTTMPPQSTPPTPPAPTPEA